MICINIGEVMQGIWLFSIGVSIAIVALIVGNLAYNVLYGKG